MTQRSLAVLVLFFFGLGLCSSARADTAPSLLVRVKDGAGRPIAGATVWADWSADRPSWQETAFQHKTSPRGTVRLSGLPVDRTVWIFVEKAGFTPDARSFSAAADAPRELGIALRPGSVAVGRVVDEKGRPVAGVEVELYSAPFAFLSSDVPLGLTNLMRRREKSGPAGRFRFRDLPEGQFSLTFSHPGYAPLSTDRPMESGTTGRLGTFVLRRGVTLRGTVTDAAGGPLAGALVWASDAWLFGELPAPAVTATDGTFTVPHLRLGTEAHVWVCAEGFLPGEETVPFPEEPIQVALQDAAVLHGRVLGPDGAPQPGATVRAEPVDGWPASNDMTGFIPCATEVYVTTDAEGRFAFRRLPSGWFGLMTSMPGFLPEISPKLRLAAGETAEDQEIHLRRGAAVSGRVLDPEGQPISGAHVQASSGRSWAAATSAADGSFRLEGLATGTLQISAFAEGFQNGQSEIDMTDDEATADVVLDPIEKDGPIEVYGQVLGPDGTPVEGALVSVSGTRASSARDGSFALRIGWRRSGEPQEIVAEKRGFARSRRTIVLKGERVDDVVVRLEAGALVNGRVLGLAAADLPAAAIYISEEDGRGDSVSARLDAEGGFRAGPFVSGTWQIRAVSGAQLAETSVVLEPGRTEAFVELAFPPAHEVRGRVLDPAGLPAAHIALSASNGRFVWHTWTHLDGTFSLQVPAGDLTLSIDQGNLHGRCSLHVGEDPATGVEIRLERGATANPEDAP